MKGRISPLLERILRDRKASVEFYAAMLRGAGIVTLDGRRYRVTT